MPEFRNIFLQFPETVIPPLNLHHCFSWEMESKARILEARSKSAHFKQ